MSKEILCSISTRGRYHTTLPMTIQSIAMQTVKPNKLVIFDDNDEPEDLRNSQLYRYLFLMLDQKNISWEVIFGQKKGQHYNHQYANYMGYEWVWRVDDDCVPDPTVLENLKKYINSKVGAVGGSILTPPHKFDELSTGKIENLYTEPNIQWNNVEHISSVDHLHCSFLYRAGVYDYNLALSRAAHREETLFTYGLKQKGYELLVVPNAITWHLRNDQGGIRNEQYEMFAHDEYIFQNFLKFKDNTIVVLDNGLGDHIVFKHVLPEIKNPVIFSCWPEIVPGQSIAEAHHLFENLDQFNIYAKMDKWNWTGSLEDAFRKLYVNPIV